MSKNYTTKVVIIGDHGVGKTSLLMQFTDKTFRDSPVITLQNACRSRDLELGEYVVTLDIWDTAGHERYKSLTSTFFRHAHGVLLVFDVSNWRSFQRIENWLEEAEQHGIGRSSHLLVGNKSDLLSERVVASTQAKSFADRQGMQYVETSAKENLNVRLAFVQLANQMLDQRPHFTSCALTSNESNRFGQPPKGFSLERVAKKETETKNKRCAC